jgi:hypothetical protein
LNGETHDEFALFSRVHAPRLQLRPDAGKEKSWGGHWPILRGTVGFGPLAAIVAVSGAKAWEQGVETQRLVAKTRFSMGFA